MALHLFTDANAKHLGFLEYREPERGLWTAKTLSTLAQRCHANDNTGHSHTCVAVFGTESPIMAMAPVHGAQSGQLADEQEPLSAWPRMLSLGASG